MGTSSLDDGRGAAAKEGHRHACADIDRRDGGVRQRRRFGGAVAGEAKFYEIGFPWTNPETDKIGTKSQQRAHGTEVQNERSAERELFFVFTATNKEIGLRINFSGRVTAPHGAWLCSDAPFPGIGACAFYFRVRQPVRIIKRAHRTFSRYQSRVFSFSWACRLNSVDLAPLSPSIVDLK